MKGFAVMAMILSNFLPLNKYIIIRASIVIKMAEWLIAHSFYYIA